MARVTQEDIYNALLDKYGQEIADVFADIAYDIRAQADLDKIIAAIKRGNIQDAMNAMHVEPEAFDPLADAIRDGFSEAGGIAAQGINAATSATVIRFSVRNPEAENWLASESMTKIDDIIGDQRVAIRNALVAGMAAGENPRDTALNIVGRIDSSTGRREGGTLLLTAQQEQYVRNARTELESGEPSLLRNYKTRTLRDQRFDPLVDTAIETRTPLDPEDVEKMAGRYSDSLLRLRGETIGRTESLTALRAGQDQAYQQAIDKGIINGNTTQRIWRTAGDERVRDSHAAMEGQIVGMNEPFETPDGFNLMFPGDTSLGAPAEEIINCRCIVEYSVDFLAQIGEEELPETPPEEQPEVTTPPEPPAEPTGVAPEVPEELTPITEDEVPPENQTFYGSSGVYNQELDRAIIAARADFEDAGVTPASLKEVEDFHRLMEKNGRGDFVTAPSIPVPGTVMGATEGLETLENFVADKPYLKGLLDQVDPKLMMVNYGHTTAPMGTFDSDELPNTYLLFNTSYDRHGIGVEPSWSMSERLGGEDPQQKFKWSMIHEMGHVLDSASGDHLSIGLADWVMHKAGILQPGDTEVSDSQAYATEQWFSKNLTGYAGKNYKEAWAEAFSGMVAGQQMHPFVTSYLDSVFQNE